MQTVRSFVDMDVHKETIWISVAEDVRNGRYGSSASSPTSLPTNAKTAKRFAKHGELDF